MFLTKRLVCALATAALLVAACDRTPTAEPLRPAEAPSLATSVTSVCSSASVPSGYVILYYTSSSGCPFYGNFNAKIIGIPGSPETVCYNSPIPSGWVIVSAGQRTNCLHYSALSFNTNTIKIPGSLETVCSTSPVPSNYVIVSYGLSYSCPHYSSGTNNTKTIQRV